MFTFENCFGTQATNQRANAIIADNRSFISDFGGNPYEYIWDNVVQNDSEIYLWLKSDMQETYDRLDSANQAVITDLLHDHLQQNFNYRFSSDNYVFEKYGDYVLQIWHTDTPDTELTQAEAEKAAQVWCEENEHYHEGMFWQEDDSDVWFVRICPNDYQG